jgi:RNA polymerase sigma factor (sigma-70 family)
VPERGVASGEVAGRLAAVDPVELPLQDLGGTPDSEVVELSFVELYRTRYSAMVRLVIALTGSDALAEDLVHDVFVRVHARWDSVENPTAYLRRSVVNACRSAARRANHERSTRHLQLIESAGEVPDELFDALLRLPYRQRAALVLQFYEGLPQAEIAAVLGCREGTVASLVHRGLQQLRRVIEP